MHAVCPGQVVWPCKREQARSDDNRRGHTCAGAVPRLASVYADRIMAAMRVLGRSRYGVRKDSAAAGEMHNHVEARKLATVAGCNAKFFPLYVAV